MPRIAVDVYALVADLLAEFRFAAGRGERTPTFFSTACVETECKEPEQIGNCLRLENRRINTGLEHARVASIKCFADRFVCDARGVEFRNVKMVAKKVTGTGAIGCSGSGR